MLEHLGTPEFWVAVSFVGFIALVIYYKAPAAIARALDDRAARIKAELDEARRLREDAQALLAEYQRKRRDAEKEAEDIITQAREEAERFSEETRQKLQESLERRIKTTEAKIAQAESQALDEVRDAAASAAVTAAARIISEEMGDKAQNEMIEAGIKDVKARLAS